MVHQRTLVRNNRKILWICSIFQVMSQFPLVEHKTCPNFVICSVPKQMFHFALKMSKCAHDLPQFAPTLLIELTVVVPTCPNLFLCPKLVPMSPSSANCVRKSSQCAENDYSMTKILTCYALNLPHSAQGC